MDIQEKIVDEIRSVIGTEKNLTLTYKNLLDLKYLTMVIKESLRIFPSVPIIGRTVDEDAMIGTILKDFIRDKNIYVFFFIFRRRVTS